MSAPEDLFAIQLKAAGIEHEREYRFNPDRRWRSDFHIPAHKLLIEIEGGLYVNGGHSRGAAYEKNLEKYNSCVLLGYRLLRYSPRMVKNGVALDGVMKVVYEKA